MIELTGLKAGLPIGFMAALGAFRNAAAIPELKDVHLRWEKSNAQWHPILDTGAGITADAFVKLLLNKITGQGDRREFSWAEAVKNVSPARYRQEAERALGESSATDSELSEWFMAFGSELVCKREEDKIESTPFDMTVARQQFLADALWLTRSLLTPDKKSGDGINLESLREALFGPWKYENNQHSLGWDPSTVLMGAFTPKAPTAMNKAGVRAAVWLAMEALPFFPCMYSGGLATTGFHDEKRKQYFKWPIWTSPLSIASVRVLLEQTPRLLADDEWRDRGVAAIYSSEIYKPNKYLSSFQPAVLEK